MADALDDLLFPLDPLPGEPSHAHQKLLEWYRLGSPHMGIMADHLEPKAVPKRRRALMDQLRHLKQRWRWNERRIRENKRRWMLSSDRQKAVVNEAVAGQQEATLLMTRLLVAAGHEKKNIARELMRVTAAQLNTGRFQQVLAELPDPSSEAEARSKVRDILESLKERHDADDGEDGET